jgi:carboxypeptidase family protein
MARPGRERFVRAALVALGVGVLAILVGAGWWKSSRSGSATLASAEQRPTSAAPGSAEAVNRHASIETPAQLTIFVSDEHGPLRDATVTLIPGMGEIIVAKTEPDGLARVERLEPGNWRIRASADDHLPAALPARRFAPGSVNRVALRLASGGRTLRGTISDTSGGAVAGARIDAAKLTLIAVLDDAVSTTVSAEDGTYRMTVPEGSLVVGVTSADYAPQSRRIDVGAAGAVVNFALVPGGVIEGVVKDEHTQEPVAGASVRAQRTRGVMFSAERHAIASSDGRFRMTGLKPGDWQLDAAAPPRYSRDTTHVGLAVGEQVSDVELRVGASLTIRGRVVDDQQMPAPDVEVRAVGRNTAVATADPAGNFVFEGLRSGDYVLSAESPSYLHSETTVVWLTDKSVDSVVVRVKHALVLKGHVEPRQPCHVQYEFELVMGRDSHGVPDVSTGPDGEFTLGPFDSGLAKLVARCASGDEGELRVQVAPETSEAVLRVVPGASLAGRVVDGTGQPVPGVSVVANASEVMSAMDSSLVGVPFHISGGVVTTGERSLTDARGTFEIRSLAPGAYGLEVLERGKPLQLRKSVAPIRLLAGEHRKDIVLQVELAEGTIAGTVSGPDGGPLADAWVSAYPQLSALDAAAGADIGTSSPMTVGPGDNDPAPPPVLTDAQGHYKLTGLFHIKYTIIVEGQRGRLRARRSEVVPDATVNLQTQGVSMLTGTVKDASGPVAVFTATLLGPTTAAHSVTDGKFVFDHINAGAYKVYVESLLGGGTGQTTVGPGDTATLEITLSANGTVAGTLVDGSGKPASGLRVVVRDDNAGEMIRPPVTTGADGRFRIDHAPGVCYLVVLRRPAPPFVKNGLTIASGKTLELGPIVLDVPSSP